MAAQATGLFTGISVAIQAIFRAITKTATAVEKVASAGDHLGGYLEATAASFVDQATAEREEKLAVLKHNLAEQRKKLSLQAAASGAETVAVTEVTAS